MTAKDVVQRFAEATEGRGSITNGPDRMAMAASVFEGTSVEFVLDGHRTGIKVVLSGVKCNDSGRRYWSFWGHAPDLQAYVEGTYWVRNGKRGGYLKAQDKGFSETSS